jgi:phosphoglycerate dehydrogenase-like enzyme
MSTNPPIDVLVTLPFPPALISRLQEVSPRLRVTVHPAHKAEDVPDELWARCEVLYTDRVLPPPAKAPAVKWVQFHYAGINHALDAPLLSQPGLLATTASGANAPQVAEYVLSLILALAHRLPTLHVHQKKSDWPRDRWERFAPQELRGSTVGIAGYGSIGRQVARLLHEFGAVVLATKRDARNPLDHGYTVEGMGDPQGDYAHRIYPAQALRSMIRLSDFVVISVPLTSHTRGLINASVLSEFKPNAQLIDISRGGVVDHPALVKALQEHKIAGAALDVFPEEPLPANSPLWGMPNVIVSPHISGNSPYYDERAAALFAENLARYVNGTALLNPYDPQRGY